LGHSIELTSVVNRGSRFALALPVAHKRAVVAEPASPLLAALDTSANKLIVVIDDDPLVLDGMGGLLRSWGCRVVSGDSVTAALSGLAEHDQPPDLIISDYRLRDGRTGIEAIERLRKTIGAQTPAFLISGDTHPEPLIEARAGGYILLHKPVQPMTLRSMLTKMLKKQQQPDLQHEI
jgi:CheY-like chemotaxis protein